MLPPMTRLPRVERLIAQRSYFVIHAPRQIGKTTAMLSLAEQLTASGKYVAAMVSAETAQAYGHDIDGAELTLLNAWQTALRYWLPAKLRPPEWSQLTSGSRISQALSIWAEACPRPIVLLIDEIDALCDDALISVLRQLRDGYPRRPKGFPSSVGLIGLRDVRDYKVASGGSDRLHTASPFNIKVESLTLRNFNESEQADPLTKGLEQLEGYLDQLKQSSGWLMIFDRRANALPLEERLATSLAQTATGQQVTVIRL
jgi:hypothetical protein